MFLELPIGYIADAVLDVKVKRFHEKFVSIEDVRIMQKLLASRLKKNGLNVKFVDLFFNDYFRIENEVITKYDSLKNLQKYIPNKKLRKAVYDEDFIYYCLCQMEIIKINNSVEHTCFNCATHAISECENFLLTKKAGKANACKRWTYNIFSEGAENMDLESQKIIEKRLVKKMKKK